MSIEQLILAVIENGGTNAIFLIVLYFLFNHFMSQFENITNKIDDVLIELRAFNRGLKILQQIRKEETTNE